MHVYIQLLINYLKCHVWSIPFYLVLKKYSFSIFFATWMEVIIKIINNNKRCFILWLFQY